MTTPADPFQRGLSERLLEILSSANIRDRATLEMLDRVVMSEQTVLEARVNQLGQLHEALQARMQNLG